MHGLLLLQPPPRPPARLPAHMATGTSTKHKCRNQINWQTGENFRNRKRPFRFEIEEFQKLHAFEQKQRGQIFFDTCTPCLLQLFFAPQPGWAPGWGRVQAERLQKFWGRKGPSQKTTINWDFPGLRAFSKFCLQIKSKSSYARTRWAMFRPISARLDRVLAIRDARPATTSSD